MTACNRVIITGNLTHDPELKQLQSGQSVCRLKLASTRQTKNRNTGALEQDTCYVDVIAWGAQANSCGKFLQKGRPVLIEGRLKHDHWKEADGSTRSKHSIVAENIVFLGHGPAAQETARRPSQNMDMGAQGNIGEIGIDDLPF